MARYSRRRSGARWSSSSTCGGAGGGASRRGPVQGGGVLMDGTSVRRCPPPVAAAPRRSEPVRARWPGQRCYRHTAAAGPRRCWPGGRPAHARVQHSGAHNASSNHRLEVPTVPPPPVISMPCGSSMRATRCGCRSGSRPGAARDAAGAAVRMASFSVTSARSAYSRRSAHAPPAREYRQQHPGRAGLADQDTGPGRPGFVEQRMAAVWFDDHDAGRAARFRQLEQQRNGHRVQPGEHRRVPDETGPEAAERVTPQHRRGGDRAQQRGGQADGLTELQGQRRIPRAGGRRVGRWRIADVEGQQPEPAAGNATPGPGTGRAPRHSARRRRGPFRRPWSGRRSAAQPRGHLRSQHTSQSATTANSAWSSAGEPDPPPGLGFV